MYVQNRLCERQLWERAASASSDGIISVYVKPDDVTFPDNSGSFIAIEITGTVGIDKGSVRARVHQLAYAYSQTLEVPFSIEEDMLFWNIQHVNIPDMLQVGIQEVSNSGPDSGSGSDDENNDVVVDDRARVFYTTPSPQGRRRSQFDEMN